MVSTTASTVLLLLVNMPNPAEPLILIVDDDRTLQMMMKVAMEQEGFSVVQAGSGEQCLQDYQRLQPDMVLIDAMMPGMDGFECCHRLRQLPKASQVPILMITVLDKPEFVDRAFQSGASDYITKPISWAVLSHRVRALIERYQSARQSEVVTTSLKRYQSWKSSQRQLRQKQQEKTAADGLLLETLQNLCQFIEGSRTLLYQFHSEQWLEATSQTAEPIISKLPNLSSDWITVLQAQFPEPLVVENSPPSESLAIPSELEASLQELQRSLEATVLWAYPVCSEGKVNAVLFVCFAQSERDMLDLEKEGIQDTTDYLGYKLPSLKP
ncbi:MAG: response regulator [Leptolyngbyaceae cyanobacterium MAG.088]|nr:response regulator [Leptolyngbyaceae cyanobacterium MAG.088]